MKKIVTLLMLIFFTSLVPAQNIDSLYNALLELKNPVKTAMPQIAIKNRGRHKCAFGLMADIKLNYNRFSPSQQKTISTLLSRTTTDTSIVSPSGYFRIHFYRQGTNAPSYSIDELAIAADSVYAFEIGYLGYPVPPADNDGENDKYDIYISNLGDDYGWTSWGTPDGLGHYASYIDIDNDFIGDKFFTSGINAAKATVAHEFHHAIQIGGYTFRSEDKYYNELSSTAMEDFVFDYVNDYIGYMPDLFDDSGRAISNRDGYEMAVLNFYIKERLGFTALREIWEHINDNRALKAINMVFEEHEKSFINEYSNFNTWLFFTGRRSVTGKYFKDAKKYPLLKTSIEVNFTPTEKIIMTLTRPVSCSLLLFVNQAVSKPDSVYALVTNADYRRGYEDPNSTNKCDYYLSSVNQTGARKIYDNYYVWYQSPVPDVLKDVNVVNNELIGENTAVTPVEINDSFPNPFNYSRHNNVAIPAPNGVSDEALLYIYTVSMKLVYSGSFNVIKTDKLFVRWNGLDNLNSKLPNGVYFYVTKRDDSIIKGKLVIQNE